MWQDVVLFLMQALFCVTLIPMIFAKEKPPLSSSLTTGLALLVMAGTMATLSLWLSTIGLAVVGVQWLILAYQRIRQHNHAAHS